MVSPIVWRTAKERRFYTHVLGIGRAVSLSSVGHFISKAWRALLAGVRERDAFCSARAQAAIVRPPRRRCNLQARAHHHVGIPRVCRRCRAPPSGYS